MTREQEREAFLSVIRDAPEDDTVRLVYADWLQENGEEDRAAFIRVQIEIAKFGWYPTLTRALKTIDAARYYTLKERELELWSVGSDSWFAADAKVLRLVQIGEDDPDEMRVLNWRRRPVGYVRRGFVFAVSLPWQYLIGGPCPECDGVGLVSVGPSSFERCAYWDGIERDPIAESCVTPSLAADLFRHPITRIKLTNREPDVIHQRPNVRIWHRASNSSHMHENERSFIPAPLHIRLPPSLESEYPGYEWVGESRLAAIDALSDACVRYGREQFAESRRNRQ